MVVVTGLACQRALLGLPAAASRLFPRPADLAAVESIPRRGQLITAAAPVERNLASRFQACSVSKMGWNITVDHRRAVLTWPGGIRW
jgi:hypothetical protein